METALEILKNARRGTGGYVDPGPVRRAIQLLEAEATKDEGTVILVETNGADPEATTRLRGNGVAVISIDWDEVARGNSPGYILDVLDRIEELGVADAKPSNHVGMPTVVSELRVRLTEMGYNPDDYRSLPGRHKGSIIGANAAGPSGSVFTAMYPARTR